MLSELQATGVYTPDCIIGISNGGLFLADTSLRLVYKNEVPMISLWARRSQEKYFHNPINNAQITPELFKALAPTAVGKRRLRILVMDDIVGTERTFNQLLDYLRERLGDFYEHVDVRFVFLFTSREETVQDLRPYLLSQDDNITRSFKMLELEAVTGKSDLPYRKSIHFGSITPSTDREERDSIRRATLAAAQPQAKIARQPQWPSRDIEDNTLASVPSRERSRDQNSNPQRRTRRRKQSKKTFGAAAG